MTPAATPTSVSALGDPVRAALADPHVQADLTAHALVVLGRWLEGRPATDRLENAREVVQETSARALAKRAGYDCAAGTVTAWLHGILNKVLLQAARTLRRQPAQPPNDRA